MEDVEKEIEEYLIKLKRNLDALEIGKIIKVVEILYNTYKNNKTVYILGNGGSPSTASHMACDLGKGTLKNVYNKNEKRMRVISLNDNIATMTAYANDLSYQDIFEHQLRNLVEEGDVVIGISASGNSPNVIKAIDYANSCGAITIGLLGFETGGKLKDLVQHDITVKSKNFGRVEDIHLVLDHIITTCLAKLKHEE